MSIPRIVSRVRTILSRDLQQDQKVGDVDETLDDTAHTLMGAVFEQLQPAAVYITVPLPNGIARIGFLYIATDAPITLRLNNLAGMDIPITALSTPALLPGAPTAGPTVIPTIQQGVFQCRFGVSNDGNDPAADITSIQLRCPGGTKANVTLLIAGE